MANLMKLSLGAVFAVLPMILVAWPAAAQQPDERLSPACRKVLDDWNSVLAAVSGHPVLKEFQRRYPEYKDFEDKDVLARLNNPVEFRKAFPEYSDASDEEISRRIHPLSVLSKEELVERANAAYTCARPVVFGEKDGNMRDAAWLYHIAFMYVAEKANRGEKELHISTEECGKVSADYARSMETSRRAQRAFASDLSDSELSRRTDDAASCIHSKNVGQADLWIAYMAAYYYESEWGRRALEFAEKVLADLHAANEELAAAYSSQYSLLQLPVRRRPEPLNCTVSGSSTSYIYPAIGTGMVSTHGYGTITCH